MSSEDERDRSEMFGYNWPCTHCKDPGHQLNQMKCLLCPDRPFGKTPCAPDLHCFEDIDGDGYYCELSLVCDFIVKHEVPLAEFALKFAGVSQQKREE